MLGQAVFPVLRGDRLLGEAYAERRQRMPEQKARVAAMRKLLVVIYGVHRSDRAGVPFDPARVHLCQSQYALGGVALPCNQPLGLRQREPRPPCRREDRQPRKASDRLGPIRKGSRRR